MSTPGIGIDTHASSGAGSFAVANEAYVWLERLSGGSLNGFKLVPEPSLTSPDDDGSLYVVGDGATGTNWAGHDGELALWLNGAWLFKPVLTPNTGAPSIGAGGLRFLIAGNAPDTDGTGTHPNRAAEARFNSGAWTVDNLAATGPPTNYDGVTGDGIPGDYRIGSRWVHGGGDKEYICTSSTPSASVWVETTASGGVGSGDPDQFLWATINGDTGTTTADAIADVLSIEGNGQFGLSTSITGDTLQITQAFASQDSNGCLLSTDFVDFFRARFASSNPIVAGFGTTGAPTSPNDGDAYVIGGTPTGGTGTNWQDLGLVQNDIAIWHAATSSWVKHTSVGGEVIRTPSSTGLDSPWLGNGEYPLAFTASNLTYCSREQRWYPLADIVTEQPYYTGKFDPNNSLPSWRVYRFETGPGDTGAGATGWTENGTGTSWSFSYLWSTANTPFTPNNSALREVTGSIENSGGAYVFPAIIVTIPNIIISLKATGNGAVLNSNSDVSLANYFLQIRTEYVPA